MNSDTASKLQHQERYSDKETLGYVEGGSTPTTAEKSEIISSQNCIDAHQQILRHLPTFSRRGACNVSRSYEPTWMKKGGQTIEMKKEPPPAEGVVFSVDIDQTPSDFESCERNEPIKDESAFSGAWPTKRELLRAHVRLSVTIFCSAGHFPIHEVSFGGLEQDRHCKRTANSCT